MISKDNIFFEVMNLLDYNELDCSEEAHFFTQFNVNRSICVPTNNGKSLILHNSVAHLDINACKVIDTIKGTSLEGQHLSSKKLLVLGTIKFTVYFFIPYICHHLFHLNKTVPFSVFIIIPDNTNEDSVVNLKYMIEDVTSTLLSKHKLFLNASIFIEYLDKS